MEYRNFYLAFVATFIIVCGTVNAQDNKAIADTIDKQFGEIIKSSNSFKGYKVINKSKINNLRKSVNDEFIELDERIAILVEKTDEKQKQIDQDKRDLNRLNKEKEEVENSKSVMPLLGMDVDKGAFQTVVWGIIVILVVLLVVFIFKYKNSRLVSVESKKNLKSMEQEYEKYRKKALDTQQRLGRELQDERNRRE